MRVVGLAAVFSLAFAVSAQAAERSFDMIASDGKTGIFIDTKSVEKTGSVVTFWNLMVGIPPSFFGPQSKLRYIVAKISMDCVAQTAQSTISVNYDANDTVLGSSAVPSTVDPINPGSLFAVEYKYVCQGQRAFPTFTPIAHIRDVLAYLDAYKPPSDAPTAKD